MKYSGRSSDLLSALIENKSLHVVCEPGDQ